MPSSNVCSNRAEALKLFSEIPLKDSSSRSSMFILPTQCLWSAKLSSRTRSAKRHEEKIYKLVTTRRNQAPFTIQWLMAWREIQRLKNASAALLVDERA